MSNNLLTIDDITREALVILHQKLNFVGNITRDYDDSFAKEGAKIGNTLRIRLPMQYATGTGATMATGTGADSVQNQVTLTVNSQRHVPMRFTSNEMTMKIDDFAQRHLEPAMAKLAAMIESDALSMVNQVPSAISGGTKVDFADVMDARAVLQKALAPADNRYALLDPQANVDLVNDNKSLFQASGEISKQYRDGAMGRFAGFDFFENTMLPERTNSASGGTSAYLTDSGTATQSGSATAPNSWTVHVDTGTKAVSAGDVFTIEGVYDVHPETKATLSTLKQFVVITGGSGEMDIVASPALIATGPYKNASNAAADGKKVTFLGAASTGYKQSLLFQKGFAVFGSADLVLPKGGVMAASRQVFDGISMRMVQDYDIVKDRIYTRCDVLYGYKVLRPNLACRIWHT